MPTTIVIAGDKGGCGKTTTSHAVAHGLALYGISAFHISTDARREIMPAESRRYATLDGREPTALGILIDRLAVMDKVVVVIDGGGGRPEVDWLLSQVGDLTVLPFMQSQADMRVVRADLDRLPDAVGLPNRWPTSKWARDVADRELAEELEGYTRRLMSPVPEINGYITLLKDTGAVPRIAGPCKQLALRVLERMGMSLFSFRKPKRQGAEVPAI